MPRTRQKQGVQPWPPKKHDTGGDSDKMKWKRTKRSRIEQVSSLVTNFRTELGEGRKCPGMGGKVRASRDPWKQPTVSKLAGESKMGWWVKMSQEEGVN